jgi:predicted lipoprotein with Yx(FWY)xxD motif
MAVGRIPSRAGRLVLAAAGLGLVLSACSSSSSTTARTAAQKPAGAGTVIDSVHSSRYGTILVSASGRTLYMFTADTSTTSNCRGACVPVWVPVTTTGTPRAGAGVTVSLLGTITRPGGSHQVTYGGHPLYTFVRDSADGQVNGEGIDNFGGHWYVVDTAGHPVTAPTSGTAGVTSGAAGYGSSGTSSGSSAGSSSGYSY